MASGRRRRNRPHLIIMRGLPGSGKTKLSRQIMEEEFGNPENGEVLSTDDYFKDKYGYYHFKYKKLRIAHEWNQNRAELAMQNGKHPIIIDNTNMRRWHMKPYVRKGLTYGYFIRFKTTPDTFTCSVKELLRRHSCAIPPWLMYRMRRNYQRVHSIWDVLNAPDRQ